MAVDTLGYIEAVRREGLSLLAAADQADLDSAVPSCPGWTLRGLLAHIGYVHRWATRYVAEGIERQVDRYTEPEVLANAPSDDVLRKWVAEGHAALLRALQDAPADLRCWTILPGRPPREFWARRQAHETAVHRVDAQLCSGGPAATVRPDLAVDGVHEMLFGFFAPPDGAEEPAGPSWTLKIEATDDAASWVMRVYADHVRPGTDDEPVDVVVRGTISDLYLLLWNRRSLADVETSGDILLLRDWRKLFQITYA